MRCGKAGKQPPCRIGSFALPMCTDFDSLQLYFKHSLHPYIFAYKQLFDSELNHVGNENPYISLHDPYIFSCYIHPAKSKKRPESCREHVGKCRESCSLHALNAFITERKGKKCRDVGKNIKRSRGKLVPEVYESASLRQKSWSSERKRRCKM